MQVAVTGATGFIGRYIVRHLADQGHSCRCWYRPAGDRGGFEDVEKHVEWVAGELANGKESSFVDGCDAVVHSALHHPGGGFRNADGDILEFVEKNVLGTIRLIESARKAGVGRFIFISTCAVHEKILDDRPLDEAHPLWSTSHYGAHKAAIEKFVHSYGLGLDYTICALRPTGVYGIRRTVEQSKWFDLVQSVVRGDDVTCQRGGKEVHAADVARAAGLLLKADEHVITGEAFNCYDRYISEYDVAMLAKKLSHGSSRITGEQTQPKHQIVTDKLCSLGMEFGGTVLFEETVQQMVDFVKAAE
jgi:nucleoside-diphosphate-sugar epimerase